MGNFHILVEDFNLFFIMDLRTIVLLVCAIGYISCECKDAERESKKGYCKLWKDGGYCETREDIMKIYCAKTCGFCHDDVELELDVNECKDDELVAGKGICQRWQKLKFCKTHEKE